MKTNTHIISTFTIQSIMVGSYAWFAAVSFGLVLIDTIYGGLVPESSGAFNEVADFLLFIKALTIVTAIGATGSAMDIKPARNLLAAGLLITISGFFLNIILSPVLGNGSHTGSILRIILNGSVSILAFLGFYLYCREPLIKISYV